MTNDTFTFSITRIPFNEDYQPAEGTRITNFANLARGASRRENLRSTLQHDQQPLQRPGALGQRARSLLPSSWTSSRWRCTSTAPTATIRFR